MSSFKNYLNEELKEYEIYTDAQGRRWNDEGEMYDRTPSKVHTPTSSGSKVYFNVPFANKDAAKAEGMKFDPQRKQWFHTDNNKAAKSKFQKV